MSEISGLFKKLLKKFEERNLQPFSVSLENLDGEKVYKDFLSKDPMPLFSITKTVLALGLCFSFEEGLLSPSSEAAAYFPEIGEALCLKNKDILVKHLMTMSSGHRCFSYGLVREAEDGADISKLFFSLPLRTAPGERFYYSNSDADMAGLLLEKVSGQSLIYYLWDRLFKPLGMEFPVWGMRENGGNVSSSKLYMYPEDLRKLSHLMLHKGAFEGQQIVPLKRFNEMTQLQINNEPIAAYRRMDEGQLRQMKQGYGYFVWLGRGGSFRADGKHGQFIAVYPEEGIVMTVLAHEEKRPYEFINALEEVLF